MTHVAVRCNSIRGPNVSKSLERDGSMGTEESPVVEPETAVRATRPSINSIVSAVRTRWQPPSHHNPKPFPSLDRVRGHRPQQQQQQQPSVTAPTPIPLAHHLTTQPLLLTNGAHLVLSFHVGLGGRLGRPPGGGSGRLVDLSITRGILLLTLIQGFLVFVFQIQYPSPAGCRRRRRQR